MDVPFLSTVVQPCAARGVRWFPGVALVALILCVSACEGGQSALDPAGRDAGKVALLFWWMAGGTIVIWLIMAWIAWSSLRGAASDLSERKARLYIIGGGAVFPTVVLAVLLLFGLGMMPEMVARAPEGSLTVKVTGEQWWWRVKYQLEDGKEVELANEIRLPVGEPVQFILDSSDVIHSFWVPPLGGKMDMIPGRTTYLALHPERTGVFRGACAEYCGGSHALMAFDVVVMEKQAFEDWLSQQARPALADFPAGRELALSNGCGACHTIRGTGADGAIGPDLTHVGSRLSIGAGTLKNVPGAFRAWLARTGKIKPSVHMPHFGMLPADELDALALYLQSLK